MKSKMPVFLLLAVIIAILTVSFALQNATPVNVSLLTFEYESSLALVLLLAVLIGIILGLLVLTPTMIKDKRAIRQQRKHIQTLEEGRSGAIPAAPAGKSAVPAGPEIPPGSTAPEKPAGDE